MGKFWFPNTVGYHILFIVCKFFLCFVCWMNAYKMVKFNNSTRRPRWPWIAHLNFWDDHSPIFFVAFREEFTRIAICLYSASSSHLLMPSLLTDQNFANNFWKGSPIEQSCYIISKFDKQFQRRRILKNFSEVYTVKKASPHGGHIFRQIKYSQTIFANGHTRNNLVKLFQIWPAVSEKKIF